MSVPRLGVDLQAPEGKFRVVGVDTFDHSDWVEGDYDDVATAARIARSRSGEMLKMYVYDDKGTYIDGFGTF